MATRQLEQGAHLYIDVNPDYGQVSKNVLLYGTDAINAELDNCLGIVRGDVWWEPTFGSDLKKYIFEPLDEITAGLIWAEVIANVALWMPHINMESGTGVTVDYKNRQFIVTINYSVKGSNLQGSWSGVIVQTNNYI